MSARARTKLDAGPARARRPRFYLATSAVAALAALAGFSLTYFRPLAAGRLRAPAFVHVHAALFFGWVALFFAQARLARAGRIAAHVKLGTLGFALSPLLVASGAYVALASAARAVAAGGAAAAEAFLIVPLTDLLAFSGLIGAAFARRRRPQSHKRLVVLATASLLPPALARALGPFGVESSIPSTFAADAFLAAGVVYDLRTNGRVHPAYLWGGAYAVAIHIFRESAGTTEAWRAIAGRLVELFAR